MAKKTKFKGYINHSYATPSDGKMKQKMYGKYYSTIDFSMNDGLNESNFKVKTTPIGTLHIANREIELTESEALKVIQTLENALSIHDKKISLGL